MQNERQRPEIRVEDLEAQANKTRGLLDEVRGKLLPNDHMLTSPLFDLVMGGKKKAANTDGEETEEDWTFDEFMAGYSQGKLDDQAGSIEAMAVEINLAMSAHYILTHGQDTAMATNAGHVISMTTALVDRMREAPVDIADEYSLDRSPLHREFEILEGVRRVVLRPSYILYEGPGRSGLRLSGYSEDGFWDERHKQADKIDAKIGGPEKVRNMGITEYHKLQLAQVEENLESHTGADWAKIIEFEARVYVEHIHYLGRAIPQEALENLDFASRLTNGGQRVFPDEVLAQERTRIEEVQKIAEELLQLQDLESIATWMKQKFGDKFTFKDILQMFYPV